MIGVPYARLAVIGAVLLALTAGVWKSYYTGKIAGRAEIQTRWDIEKQALVELANRTRDNQAQANQKVDRENQKRKSVSDFISIGTEYSLRQFQAAAARSGQTAAAACRADAAASSAASELAEAAAKIDAYARERADQVTGLQSYITAVCQPN